MFPVKSAQKENVWCPARKDLQSVKAAVQISRATEITAEIVIIHAIQARSVLQESVY